MEGHYQTLGVSTSASIDEIRSVFLEKSVASHPDRHPGNLSASVTFKKLNEAFVEVLKDLQSEIEDEDEDSEMAIKLGDLLPGEVDIKGSGMAISIEHPKLWKQAMRAEYPTAVVGKQRKNSNTGLKMKYAKGSTGTRFTIRFKLKGNDDLTYKTALSIYDCDLMVVTGPSYYIWIINNYKDLKRVVQEMYNEKMAKETDDNGDQDDKTAGEQEEGNESAPVSMVSESSNCCYKDCGKMVGLLEKLSEQVESMGSSLEKLVESQKEIVEKLGGDTLDGDESAENSRYEDLKEWLEGFCKENMVPKDPTAPAHTTQVEKVLKAVESLTSQVAAVKAAVDKLTESHQQLLNKSRQVDPQSSDKRFDELTSWMEKFLHENFQPLRTGLNRVYEDDDEEGLDIIDEDEEEEL